MIVIRSTAAAAAVCLPCSAATYSSLIRLHKPTHRLVGDQQQRRTFVSGFVDNFSIYASNSYVSRAFAQLYEALSSADLLALSPCTSLLGVALAARLVALPFYVHSERVASRRMMAIEMIRKEVYERVAGHYGIKAVRNMDTGKWALEPSAQASQTLSRNTEVMARERSSEYLLNNRLSLGRFICLRICTFPLWIHVAMGLRTHIEVSHQMIPGFLWMETLSMPDPTYVLPVCVGALAFLNIWAHRWAFLSSADHYRWSTRLVDGLLVLVTCFSVRFALEMPALMPIYWCFILCTGLVQSLSLRHPTVKRALGIGPLPSDTATPIRDLFRRRKMPPAAIL